MRAKVLILLLFSVKVVFSQSLLENITTVRSLISETKYEEAYKAINNTGDAVFKTRNDTIIAIYCELYGRVCKELGKYKECIDASNTACSLFEKIQIRKHDYIQSLFNIAVSYYNLQDYKSAEIYYRKSLLRSTFVEGDGIEEFCANIYLDLGVIYNKKGDTLLANESFKACIMLLNPNYDVDNDISIEEVINQFGLYYIKTGDARRASQVLFSFLKNEESRLDNIDHEILTFIYHNLGRSLMLTEEYAGALKYLNMSKKLQIEINGNVFDRTQQYINECQDKK